MNAWLKKKILITEPKCKAEDVTGIENHIKKIRKRKKVVTNKKTQSNKKGRNKRNQRVDNAKLKIKDEPQNQTLW